MTDELNRPEDLVNESAAPTGAAELTGIVEDAAAAAVVERAQVPASPAADEQAAAAVEAPMGDEAISELGGLDEAGAASEAPTPSPQRGRGLAIGAIVAAVLLVAALGIGYVAMGGQQAVIPAQGASSSAASSAVSSQVAASSSAASSASAANSADSSSSSSAAASSAKASAAASSSASSDVSSSQAAASSASTASPSSGHESSAQDNARPEDTQTQETHVEQPGEEVVEVIEYIDEEPVPDPAQEQATPVDPSPSPAPAQHADPAPAPEPEPEPAPAPEPVSQNMQVVVTINSDAADGQVSAATTVELPEGATVYDALMAAGVSVTTKETSMGLYVVGINGLNEKDYGGASGWTYYVNGGFPLSSANDYVLSNGDTVDWIYVS